MLFENITAMHVMVFENKQKLLEIRKSKIYYIGNFKQKGSHYFLFIRDIL